MRKAETSNEKMQSALRLRQIRESSKLTQEQFSELLDISVSAYKKVESGENQVSINSLRKLHKVMNVSTDYILYGDNQGMNDTWQMILNCSESDKMLLFLRLLLYFTKDKDTTFPLHDNELNENTDITQFINKLLGMEKADAKKHFDS